nr:UvrD-helicase domain-containing protein [uncultured Cetobacterium sp.]
MKFLITDYFFKSIPIEKNEKVLEKLHFFYNAIKNNYKYSYTLPKGFWIKKIKGADSLFEFRVDSGDRIFFILNQISRELNGNIIFLLYSSHDNAVKKAKRKEISENILNEFIIFDENDEIEYIDEQYFNWNNIVTYEILEDYEFIKNYNDQKYKYYYLNDEQFSCLSSLPPYFVAGSAGSGKSTLTLRKLLNIEENNSSYNLKNVLYLTANQLLKENSEEQYKQFRNILSPSVGDFFSVKDFFKKHLKIKKNQIAELEKFKEYLLFSYPNFKKLKISIEDIYSEINGIIKGIMIKGRADNWNRDFNKNLIPIEDYLNLPNKYSTLDLNTKKIVYSIAENYNLWLIKNNYYDLNDLAIELLKLNIKYDFIIIDEIQDLTEVQIFTFLSLATSKENIFIAGDIHQMINSTFFSFERVKNLFYSMYKHNINVNILSKNYRSCKRIVDLANHFSSLRSTYIGNLGIDDYKEISIQDAGNISLTNINLELIKQAQNDSNFAIVVPNEEEKLNLYEQLDNKHRIFTILEIKGLEYKNIICYNLASFYIDEWNKILSKEVKQDQRYRKFFNIFYVGITRAQENLIIMEQNIENNPMLDQISSFLVKNDNITIEEKTKTLQEDQKDWLKEAIKLYKLEKYSEAQYAFELANEPTWILERDIENDISELSFDSAIKKIQSNDLSGKQNYYKKLIIDTCIENLLYFNALEKNQFFGISYREKEIKEGIKNLILQNRLSKKEIQKILQIYKLKKDSIFVGDILLELKKYSEALLHYQNINNQKGIKLARKGLLSEKFGKLENFEEKINDLEGIIDGKNINSYGKKDKLTPLHRALILKKDPILFKMILVLGGNINTYIKGKYTIPEACFIDKDIPLDVKNDFIDIFINKNFNFNINYYVNTIINIPKLLKLLCKKELIDEEFYLDAVDHLLTLLEKGTIPYRKLTLAKNILKNHKRSKKEIL